MEEKYSIYWMRFLAILLIVNSHFTAEAIKNFEQFGFYGQLGFFGNMIFVFISAYILALGFKKYEKQVFKWLIYRLAYLLLIIVSLSIFFDLIAGKELVEIGSHLSYLLIGIRSIISVLVYLSLLFPLFYFFKKLRKAVAVLSFVGLFVFFLIFQGKCLTPGTTCIYILHTFSYFFIFQIGIIVAKKEVNFSFKKPLINTMFLGVFILLFILAKVYFDNIIVKLFIYTGAILYLFYTLESFNLNRIPKIINSGVSEIAKLSLYIYITHFTFVAFSYSISKYFALIVIFVILVPVCYLESIILNPVIECIRKVTLQGAAKYKK